MANVLFRDKSILLRFSARQDVGQSEQRFKLLELCSAGFPIVQTQAKCQRRMYSDDLRSERTCKGTTTDEWHPVADVH